jgi:hypothetical protein
MGRAVFLTRVAPLLLARQRLRCIHIRAEP